MMYRYRLTGLLIALMMIFSCMLPCSASATEDWSLFNVVMLWTNAEGAYASVRALPIESADVEIFWAQVPEDVPAIQTLQYTANHPDHDYYGKCTLRSDDVLMEYPEEFSPETANMVFQIYEPSDPKNPCDQLYVYFSTLPVPEESE